MNYYYNPYYPWPYYPPRYEHRYCPCCGRPYDTGYGTYSNTQTANEFYEFLLKNKKEEEKGTTDSGPFSPGTK